MPLDLQPKDFYDAWTDKKSDRDDMALRQNYYDGEHKILKRNEFYSDQSQKTNRVVNWVRFIINRYVGLLTSTPYQVTANDDSGDTTGVDFYTEVANANDLSRLDVQHLRSMLVKGRSVEVHGWVDGVHRIYANDPMEWVFIRDDEGNAVAAVRKIEIKKGVYYEDALLDSDIEVLTVYDDTHIRHYRRKKGGQSQDWQQIGGDIQHLFDTVPVIEFTLNENAESHIRDSMIGLSDEFNEIFSTAGDDVRREVDALLKITNIDAGWILANADAIRQARTLPLQEGSDADYIQRSVNTEPMSNHLSRTREALHMSGEVPDVEQIVGATGDTSGIALQLKFLPMLQQAASMSHYIKVGIRDRIDLINDRLRQTGRPQIENYGVIVQYTLPVNRIEEWQNIKNLDGVVSHRTQLELLSDVANPEQELLRLDGEQQTVAVDQAPEEVAARRADAIVEQSANMKPQLDELVALLTTAVRDVALSGGVIDRALEQEATQ